MEFINNYAISKEQSDDLYSFGFILDLIQSSICSKDCDYLPASFIKYLSLENNIHEFKSFLNSVKSKEIREEMKSAECERHANQLVEIISNINFTVSYDKCVSDILSGVNTYKLVEKRSNEAEIKDKTYLFHGSNYRNWFSIIYNGLKVYSNTDKMANGCAFGSGIYLSNDLNLSCSYSKNKEKRSRILVGVFEVTNAESYKRNKNIYVVNNADHVILKYLVEMPYSENITIINSMSQYFTIHKKSVDHGVKKYVSNMKNKRLLGEFNKIMKAQTKNIESDSNDFIVDSSIDNLNLWNVHLINVDKDSNLYSDMKDFNVDCIELEVEFNNKYPIEPPSVRVLRPTFKNMTGHVTDGGSICYELLTNHGWSPAITMESLLISIKAIISEDGRLEERNGHPRYNKKNAEDSHKRVLKAHKWDM